MHTTKIEARRQPNPAMLAYTMVRRLRAGGDVDPAQISDPDISRAMMVLRSVIITTRVRR